MGKKRSTRRASRRPTPQPPIYTEIDKRQTLDIIRHIHAPFFFGDGAIDPNLDASGLTRITGERWLERASDVADMDVEENRDQWEGSLPETAFDKVVKWWRNQPGHQQRRRPMIYRVNAEAMQQQASWAANNGARF